MRCIERRGRISGIGKNSFHLVINMLAGILSLNDERKMKNSSKEGTGKTDSLLGCLLTRNYLETAREDSELPKRARHH